MHDAGTLVAASVSRSSGARPVLADVDLVVPPRARVGLVAPNGGGKSTLLRVLAGLEPPDSGRVRRLPATLRVGYLPQELDARPDETLLAFLERRTGLAAAAATMDAIAAELGRRPELADDYADALDRFLALGGGDLEARAAAACAEVGLRAERLARPLGSLSGGEAARASLAAILLSRFDCLLLDEPTNDLDLDGLARLERFVEAHAGSLVVVSHDRAFLDRCVTRVVELAPESGRVREFAGGWSEYAAERERARARRYAAFGAYETERERIVEQARRMRQWEERGYGQGRKKKKGKDVKGSSERRLARIEPVEKPHEPWRLRLELAPRARAGEVVLRLEGAVVAGSGGFRLGPLDLALGRGDRLALVGPNGSGKSTLLAALAGRLPLVAGRRFVGPGVVVGELRQRASRRPARSSTGSSPRAAPRPRTRGRCSRSSGSARITSCARPRRSRPASGRGRGSRCCRRAASTASSSTSRRTTSIWRRSRSSSRRSAATRARSRWQHTTG